ncbi:hypothetical protein LWHH1689_0209 [Limosilactobacillus reuteri]|uniref:Uncharacterized protein n=1 Tax=Limosilactobacillus reuteri TaxID=1598 RepID=A0A2S1ENN6_LIMRT|nr:hypothetical protein LWHH1689_0209 [Limosilactobacillus reuteri]
METVKNIIIGFGKGGKNACEVSRSAWGTSACY